MMNIQKLLAACAVAIVWSADAGTSPARAETQSLLNAAIVRALNADPNLKASQADVDAAIANIRQAGVRPNPTVGFDAENFGGSGPLSNFDGAEFTLSVEQRIERGGKRHARIGLAEQETGIARARARTTRLNVIRIAQKAYADALAAEANVENVTQRAQLAGELRQAVQSRVQVGRASQAAEHRAELQWLAAQTDLDQAHRARDIARADLAALWGGSGADVNLDADALFDISGPEDAAVRDNLALSPDLAVLRAVRSRAEAATLVAKANGSQDPSVSVGVRQFQDTDDVAGIVKVAVPLPLFNNNQGNIDNAHAELRRTQWQLAAAKRDLERQLAALTAGLGAAREEAKSLRDQLIPKADKASRLTRHGYETGAFTYLEVIEALRAASDLRTRYILALKNYHVTRAELDRLTERFAEPLLGEEHKS